MEDFALKAVATFCLIIWGGFCAGILWEPSRRAGEYVGRWLVAKIFGIYP